MTVAFKLLFLLFVSSPLVTPVAAYTLTLTNPMAGSGDINGTVSCTIGPTDQCITTVTNGTELTLTASPDWKSLFDGWGTPCSGTGSCVFTLNADTEVTARFSPNYQTKVLGMSMVERASLTDAYADANGGNTIAAHVYTFMEDLTLDRPIFVKFYGGREGTEYLSHLDSYFTTIQGVLEIQLGSIEIDSLIIQ